MNERSTKEVRGKKGLGGQEKRMEEKGRWRKRPDGVRDGMGSERRETGGGTHRRRRL